MLLGLGSGCAMPGPTPTIGWHFEVGRPATIQTPATVEQTNGPVVVNGLAALPANGQLRGAFAADAAPCGPTGPSSPVTAALAPRGSCDLTDVCSRLDRIESRLNKAPEPLSMPMPKGQP
jgi:hypothetical protein